MNVIDPTGLEFTPESADDLAALESEIVLRLFKNNRRISKLEKKNSDKGESKARNRRIDRKKAENEALTEVASELQVLAASDQVYNITHSDRLNTDDYLRSGTEFNFGTGAVDITLCDSSLGMLAHELKHAYQFETGSYSLGPKKYIFYDITDEQEAYNRGALFGAKKKGIEAIKKEYDIPVGPLDYKNHPDFMYIYNNPSVLTKAVKNVGRMVKDEKSRLVFRINGQTYY